MKSLYSFKLSHQLAVADVIPHKGYYILTRLNVPFEHRRKGYGSDLLNKVTHDADMEEVILVLQPTPYDPIQFPKGKLIDFYKDHSFVVHNEGIMVRLPALYRV